MWGVVYSYLSLRGEAAVGVGVNAVNVDPGRGVVAGDSGIGGVVITGRGCLTCLWMCFL